MRILIVGCGYVGSKLADMLVADGHEIYACRRDVSDVPAGSIGIAADVTRPESLNAFPSDIDYIVYAVAAKERSEQAYQLAYVDGLKNVIAYLESSSPNLKRFFFVSSTGVYGQSQGEEVDEDSETSPKSFTGQKVLEGELALLESNVPGTIIRFAGIYGPGRNRLVRAVQSGELVVSANDKAFTNRIHRDDCAGMLRHLMGIEDRASIYVGVDDEPVEKQEVYQWLAEQLSLQLVYEPDFRVYVPDNLNKRINNQRIKDAGYVFKYSSFREGYGEMLGV